MLQKLVPLDLFRDKNTASKEETCDGCDEDLGSLGRFG